MSGSGFGTGKSNGGEPPAIPAASINAGPIGDAQAHTAATGEFYDDMWRAWGSLESASPAAFHRRRIVLGLVARQASSSGSVLEVGCGPGVLLRDLAREYPVARLHGADVSPESLRTAAQTCPDAEFFQLDLDAPTFESDHAARLASFDLVIASEVLEHLADDRRAAQRLASLLVPGGRLIITVPGGARTRFDLAIGHVRHYTRRSLELLLRDVGFEVEHAMAWGFPFHTLYRGAVRLAARVTLQRPNSSAIPRKSGESTPANAAAAESVERVSAVERTSGADRASVTCSLRSSSTSNAASGFGAVSASRGANASNARRPNPVLAFGYRVAGTILKPLYYLNRPFWGSQLFLVARKARV